MGDMVVSALVRDVLGRLTSVVIEEFGLLWGFKDDVLTLKNDFDMIEAVIHDAEEKQNKEKVVELWLKSLRSASLMVENVLDDVLVEAMLQRLRNKRGIKYKVRAFFSSDHNQLMFRVRIAHKVKTIKRKLDAIASKRMELNLTPNISNDLSHVDVGFISEMPDRETSSLIHSSLIFGRNEEMEMVTEKICNKDIGKHDDDEIRVYGIWGMGGVGKTTLAQLVYNNDMVNKHFKLKCWIYVSEKFEVKEIVKGIIESIDTCECRMTHLNMLEEYLQNKLTGKKFFIVLDDVWIEDDEKSKWDEISKTISCGAEGSIVLMTTRSQTTSRMMAKVPELQHNLGCLSENDSWLLFKKYAFEKRRERIDINELEPIGREIVERCKGLPLAVKTLGSLMWSKSSPSDWERVRGSNIWELRETNVLPALKLSYYNLLPHLRRCFAYCCLFPKGYDMKKDVLIQLWVSNGFIPPTGEIDLYVLGEEIFNCLVWRSFFQVVKDNTSACIMHDSMHDMARDVMKHDCLLLGTGNEVMIPNELLHLSSSCPGSLFSPEDLRKLTSLRSIFMFGKKYTCNTDQIFNHLLHLRVLYLCDIGLRTLPESICKLKHLKYLNLSYSNIEVLPESILYLQNLQVLLLYYCEKLCKLPEGLRYMSNLQRLDINCCFSLMHMPLGIKDLTSLRMLSKFPVGNKSGAKIEELGHLNLLEGELMTSQLENVGGFSEAKSANLKCKNKLSVLKLRWSEIDMRERKSEMFACEEVLEGLEPNPCLKRLKIYYFMGKNISPTWMVDLKNLVKISFYFCNKCEHIPPLGRLPNLKAIYLWCMASLKCFHYEDDKNMLEDTNLFLCLQELEIYECPNLIALPNNLPKLKVLKLEECDMLLSLPNEIQSFKDLNKLRITNCKHLSKRYEKDVGVDWPKISHVVDFRIDSRNR